MWRRAFMTAVVLSAGLSLGGCGSLNTIMSTSMADLIPHWAGGLPPDAPPRPGDPRYDEYERAQRARALVPPPDTETTGSAVEEPEQPRSTQIHRTAAAQAVY